METPSKRRNFIDLTKDEDEQPSCDSDCNCQKCEDATSLALGIGNRKYIFISSDHEEDPSSSSDLDIEPMSIEYTTPDNSAVRWHHEELAACLFDDAQDIESEDAPALKVYNKVRKAQGLLPVPWIPYDEKEYIESQLKK